MIDEQQPRGRREPRLDRIDDLRRVAKRQRHGNLDEFEVFLPREAPQRLPDRVIDVVGRDDPIASLPGHRAKRRIDRLGRIGDEAEALRIGTDKGRHRFLGGGEQFPHPTTEHLDRAGLDAITPHALPLEHGSGAGPEAAVVQKDDARVEQPSGGIDPLGGRERLRRGERGWQGHRGRLLPTSPLAPRRRDRASAQPSQRW